MDPDLGSEAEFKEFDPRLKFKPRLKYSWFHLKLNKIFQDLSRRSIKTGFGGFKFIKFGHRIQILDPLCKNINSDPTPVYNNIS